MNPSEIDSAKSSDAAGDTQLLTPEARRALAEAEARRQKAAVEPAPREIGGRDGPEPTRFGDWEKAGLTSDF